jgi:hypothetical protein
MSSVKLIKDEIAVSASGEREVSKSVESDQKKQGDVSVQPNVESTDSNCRPSILHVAPFVKAKKQRSQEPGTPNAQSCFVANCREYSTI